jgi:hypothetical protein
VTPTAPRADCGSAGYQRRRECRGEEGEGKVKLPTVAAAAAKKGRGLRWGARGRERVWEGCGSDTCAQGVVEVVLEGRNGSPVKQLRQRKSNAQQSRGLVGSAACDWPARDMRPGVIG